MVAYKKLSPSGTEADFLKTETIDRPNPKTKNWPLILEGNGVNWDRQ